VKNKLETIEKSDKYHFIEESNNVTSKVSVYDANIDATEAQKMADSGIPIGSSTILNFSKEEKERYEKTEGVEDSDFGTVCHEMQHEYDLDQGEDADDQDNTAEDPSEIRAVNNENRGRTLLGFFKRLTYGGKKIDKDKLE